MDNGGVLLGRVGSIRILVTHMLRVVCFRRLKRLVAAECNAYEREEGVLDFSGCSLGFRPCSLENGVSGFSPCYGGGDEKLLKILRKDWAGMD